MDARNETRRDASQRVSDIAEIRVLNLVPLTGTGEQLELPPFELQLHDVPYECKRMSQLGSVSLSYSNPTLLAAVSIRQIRLLPGGRRIKLTFTSVL